MAKRKWTPDEIEKLVRPKPGSSQPRFHDIEGLRFGLITVGRYCGYGNWEAICDCGTHFVASRGLLIRPENKSCGCYKKSKSITRTPEWKTWVGIKSRCVYKSAKLCADYAGRGIAMHPNWVKSFEAFLKDVGPRPTKFHTIDRIDNNGNYEPGNVRWATRQQQNSNTRRNRFIVVNGVSKTITEWSREFGVITQVISYRLAHGWDAFDAVSFQPRMKHGQWERPHGK